MLFRRPKTPPITDIDSKLAAFDRAYAGMFALAPAPVAKALDSAG